MDRSRVRVRDRDRGGCRINGMGRGRVCGSVRHRSRGRVKGMCSESVTG